VTAGLWWPVAAGLAALAIVAGWRDRQRRLRTDPDRVGAVDWPSVQVLALLALAIMVSLALA